MVEKEGIHKATNVRKCGEKCKNKEGNCNVPGQDNLPIQCVGPWAEDKYFFLIKYLKATKEARRGYYAKGNAVYIDLYAGPGRCIIKDVQKEIESGSLISTREIGVPFNEYIFLDISKDNTDALAARLSMGSVKYSVERGDSNEIIRNLVPRLLNTNYKLHFVYIDPFRPKDLSFETLKELAKLDHLDMLIHFPLGPIKRNLSQWSVQEITSLDEFLGTKDWRTILKGTPQRLISSRLFGIFESQLISIGFPKNGLRIETADKIPALYVRNTKNAPMYALILASKHRVGQKIWDSVIKRDRRGQGELFLL